MSYSGTVRCSWCYKQGHNRAGCPERKKYALDNPDTYEGRKYFAEQERKKKSVENRACSYCGGKDHNRRGCKILKEDKSLISQRQEQYERDFANACNAAGLGIGTLIKVEDEYDTNKQWVGLITSLCPDNIDFLFQDSADIAHYSRREMGFFKARVVSVSGYSEESTSSWRRAPQFNDHMTVTAGSIQTLVPELFSDTESVSARNSGNTKAAILSKSTGKLPEKFNNNVPESVLKRFCIKVEKNADKWDKKRVRAKDTIWRNVRPDEYKEANAPDERGVS